MVDIRSEAAGIYAEQVWKEKYQEIDSVKQEILDVVDECIGCQSEEGIAALYELYSDKGFIKKFEGDKEMAYLYIALLILQDERLNGERCTVLSGKQNIQELISYIKEIKFKIWRIQFVNDLEAAAWLTDNTEKGNISRTCIDELIKRYCGTEAERVKNIIGELHG